jgi:hypothetical protein
MSARERADIGLSAHIHNIHRRSRQTYGSPMIHAELADEHGIRVGRKRVARLMRAAGLRGATLRKFVVTTVSAAQAPQVADLVERRFYADRPNRLWVADATYIPTWSGFLYLAIVLDVFSRKVVGWAMENHLRTELMLAAIDMAITMRRPEQVIHHSDHGCQGTPATLSASVAAKPASCLRWAPSGMRTITRWPNRSSQRSSAKCSTAGASRARPKRRWQSLIGWRAGTILIVGTLRWAIALRSPTSAMHSSKRRSTHDLAHRASQR